MCAPGWSSSRGSFRCARVRDDGPVLHGNRPQAVAFGIPVFAMPRPLICWVTDRHRLSGDASQVASFEAVVQRAAVLGEAGIDIVQVRERDLEGGALTELAERCVAAVKGLPTKVLVNDRLDVAIAAGAHGVHLRGDSVPSPGARAVAPPGFLIGRSVHSADQARAAATEGGVDYLVLGTIYPSASKTSLETVVGLAELQRAVEMVRVPVLAIGGITEDRLSEVARTGAAGFAAIGLFSEPGEGAAFMVRARRIVDTSRRLFDTGEAVLRQ